MIQRRAIGIVMVVGILMSPAAASADLAGSRRMERDNIRCARLGERYERNGLTQRERQRLERRHCVRDQDGWYSGLFYPAGQDSDS